MLFLYSAPASSLAFDADIPSKFKACQIYAQDIRDAVERRFPDDFQYPNVWAAQLYQESLCNPSARSPAGAGGIAQFMRGTALDVSKRFGYDFDRFNARQAIDKGADFQARLTNNFRRRNRTPEQAYELGACAYNAGLGNCLKAQKACHNARLWSEISPCQVQITGRHAQETITYVNRIKRWTHEMGDKTPWDVPDGWRKEFTSERREALFKRVPVRRHFTGQSWCTYFPWRSGWVSAGHCHDEIQTGTKPPFIEGLKVHYKAGVIDAVFYGVDMNGAEPPIFYKNEPVETIGYPAGSDALAYRKGHSYYVRRDGGESYEFGGDIIALIAGPRPTFEREPVVGGQSGSPGFNTDGEPVCIVVTQNGQTDLNKDRRPDNSFDCVYLYSAWNVFKEP